MDRADVSFWLSIIGTITAFVLAFVKGYEFFSAGRIRLKATVTLTSREDIGNTIVILNKSAIPANIHYFDLAWVERRPLFGLPIPFLRKVVRDDSPIDAGDTYHAVIAPHSTHTLGFSEQYHFDWGVNLKQDIYLRLWLVGREGPI